MLLKSYMPFSTHLFFQKSSKVRQKEEMLQGTLKN
jgi:hypothetical protein